MVHEHVSRHVNCDSDRTRLNRCCPLRLVIYLAVWLIRSRNEEEPGTSFQINLNCRNVSKALSNYKYLSCFKNPVHSEDYISKKKKKRKEKKRKNGVGAEDEVVEDIVKHEEFRGKEDVPIRSTAP